MSVIENYSWMLEGYLLALQRISTSGYKFAVNWFPIEGSLNESIEKRISEWGVETKLVSKFKLNYKESTIFLKEYIYRDLSNLSPSKIKLFDWDVQEVFGLMSTSINPNGDFNPFVSNGGYILNFSCKDNSEVKALLVLIENYGVIIIVSKNA